MIYKFCRKEKVDGDLWIELDDIDKVTALDYVKHNKDSLQTFAYHGTGNIYGYAVQVDGSKTRALLYQHPEHGLIWIDLD